MSWPEKPLTRTLEEWQRRVEQRGRALRRRRRAVLAASVGATVAVGVAVPLTVVSSTNSSLNRLHTVTPAGSPTATPVARHTPSGQPAAAHGESGSSGPGTSREGRPSSPAARGSSGTSKAVAITPAPSLPSSLPTGSRGYPLASACSVNSVGLAPGQSRRCQFTARFAGGWVFDDSAGGAGFGIPRATLVVIRAGRSTTYRSEYLTSCADAVIKPGDRVRLTLTAPTAEVSVVYRTGAGRGWDCSHEG